MAHDDQNKDSHQFAKVRGFDYPKKGEQYWNRRTHKVEVALEDLSEKFLIVEDEE